MTAQKPSDLKPCPFCGCLPEIKETVIDLGMSTWSDGLGSPSHLGYSTDRYVTCTNCNARNYMQEWNTRADLAPPQPAGDRAKALVALEKWFDEDNRHCELELRDHYDTIKQALTTPIADDLAKVRDELSLVITQLCDTWRDNLGNGKESGLDKLIHAETMADQKIKAILDRMAKAVG